MREHGTSRRTFVLFQIVNMDGLMGDLRTFVFVSIVCQLKCDWGLVKVTYNATQPRTSLPKTPLRQEMTHGRVSLSPLKCISIHLWVPAQTSTTFSPPFQHPVFTATRRTNYDTRRLVDKSSIDIFKRKNTARSTSVQ
ncbi:hypothetical protein HBH70_183870 [Parastagonospora nodorum]|nr:hypothetical protein HBH52_199160 [Parastagonospora nodorum]KAH4062392.1 hypothetical protein HBH50_208360 [Parastagonospora nodorum]KAH4080703.1 hypothetical protein HBH48_206950 [Parastagonospora nodorum]KAH4208425.1 hypothetical protein HBI95_090440 [Parastagonospora nodorum]KAH4291762.1 hypothetical protein HBI01_186920 [Parastagonospora nodorum]